MKNINFKPNLSFKLLNSQAYQRIINSVLVCSQILYKISSPNAFEKFVYSILLGCSNNLIGHSHKHILILCTTTRVCGITGSASDLRWRGYGFNSRPKPQHS